MPQALADGAEEPRDLPRILALPERVPVDCERDRSDPSKRRWQPETQALIDWVTARFARPRRLSCGCRDRHVRMETGGQLVVFHTPSPGQAPPPPLRTTVDAFCADNASDDGVLRQIAMLKPGYYADLKGVGSNTLACITELNPVQAWTLWEYPRAGGIFGMVSVGGGKSMLGMLLPLATPHLRKWVLLIKPDQRLHYLTVFRRMREHFRVPSTVFYGIDGSRTVDDESPTVHVVPYSLLSNSKSTELLDEIDPDGVIADECHLLAAKSSARTLRFLRFFAKRPGRVLACWSGSTIKKRLCDASHLAAHSLGLGSPYPILPRDVDLWSGVIDPALRTDTSSPTARALYRTFGGGVPVDDGFLASAADPDAVRNGHRDRVVRTLGVISTLSSSINCSVRIRERKVSKLPDSVRSALSFVRDKSQRPDEEELVTPMEVATCARDVSCGFYNYWAYPKMEAPELIERWRAARKFWHKELRVKLAQGEAHLDSPRLCANAAERAWRSPRYEGDLPVWPAESWPAWAAVKDLVDPDPRTRWIDDYLARDAAEWALKPDDNGGYGIVWVQSIAFGRRVAELAGINYHGGGADAEARINAETGKQSIVASIQAHGVGRDGLQFKFYRQLIAESPSSGDLYEQLLGRLARQGQPADTVDTEVYRHTREVREAFSKAYELSQFIEAMTPNRQLLLAADCDFEI